MERVELKPVGERDASRLSAPGATGEFNELGAPDRDLVLEAAGFHLAVCERGSGRLLGEVSWHLVRHGPNRESRAWNIGINLLPEARGHGFGGEAQRLLAEHLFASTELDRVEASTDVDNLAEQRALEKAGFSREGVLRGAQFRAGRRRDLVLYSLLRTDLQTP